MKKWIAMLITLCLLCSVTTTMVAEQATYKLGDHVEDFSVTLSDGTETSLYGLLAEKKAVLINFWASWCMPCKMEFPSMQTAFDQMSDEIGVIALDIEANDTDETVLAVKEELGLTSLPMGMDVGQADRFGVEAYPTSALIDRNGVVCFLESRSMQDETLFLRLFSVFTAEDYNEPVLLTEVPDAIPAVETPAAEVLTSALNIQQSNVTVTANSAPSAWSFVPCADGEGVEASNTNEKGTTAVLTTAVTVQAGEALSFDYLGSFKDFSFNFFVYVDDQPVARCVSNADWTTDCIGFDAAGEHTVAFAYMTSGVEELDNSLKLRNLRVISAEEAAPMLEKHPAVPAKNSAEVGSTVEVCEGELKPAEVIVRTGEKEEVATQLSILTTDTLKLRVKLDETLEDVFAFVIVNGEYNTVNSLPSDEESYVYEYQKGVSQASATGSNMFAVYNSLMDAVPSTIGQYIWCDSEEDLDTCTDFCRALVDAQGEDYDEIFWRYTDGSDKQDAGADAAFANYEISVTDAEGHGIAGVMLQICDESTCQLAQTDAEGLAKLTLAPYAYEIHVLMAPEGYVRPETVDVLPVSGGNLAITLEKQ